MMRGTLLAELQIYSLVTTYAIHTITNWHVLKRVHLLCALCRCLTAFYGKCILFYAMFPCLLKQRTGIMLGYAPGESGFGVAGDPAARSVQVGPFHAGANDHAAYITLQ